MTVSAASNPRKWERDVSPKVVEKLKAEMEEPETPVEESHEEKKQEFKKNWKDRKHGSK